MNGERSLFKETVPLTTVTLQDVFSRFTLYLESSIDSCRAEADKEICTVFIGHNAKWFDIPVLLRNSTSGLHERLQAIGVLFDDSLSLFEQVVNSNHPALQQPYGRISVTNQSALYKCLFPETFEAHDALEYVTALRKMMFSSKLKLSEKLIVTHCKLISCHDALTKFILFRSTTRVHQENIRMKALQSNRSQTDPEQRKQRVLYIQLKLYVSVNRRR